MSETTENKNIIPPDIPVGFDTDPAEDAAARDKITDARISLVITEPWFGTMATRMQVVNADKWLHTAATDGRNLFYNSKFINMLDKDEVEFLVGHEVLHTVYQHIGRASDQNHNTDIGSVAADYVVNGDLVHAQIGKTPTSVPTLIDKKYFGWSYERVYADLMKNCDNIDIESLCDMLLDQHLSQDDSEYNQNTVTHIDVDENGDMISNAAPEYTKEELQKIRDEIKDALINSSKMKEAGNIPLGIQRIMDNLTDPKMDWRALLSMTMKSLVKSDYSFMKPNKKGIGTSFTFPGMIPEDTIDIAVAVDMSGSISDKQARDFFSEIKGIMEMYSDFSLKLWCFDTKVAAYAEFDSLNLNDILKYKPKGGGGTSFECNWNFMKLRDINPAQFVMFTDGFPNDGWGDPDYCDTLFIIHDDNAKIVPPFGTYAYYDDK